MNPKLTGPRGPVRDPGVFHASAGAVRAHRRPCPRRPSGGLAWLACVLLAACATTARQGPGTVQTLDGVPLSYDVQGQGEVALVMVHGWACSREFWREQVPAFTDDFVVVTLDLPGHGASGGDRSAWSVPGLADDVLAVVEAEELERVVIVGHSMGGWVGLAAAARSDRVLGVVGIDTLHDAEFVFPPEMIDFMAERYRTDFEGAMGEGIAAMVPGGAETGLARWVTERALRTDRDAAVSLMEAFAEVDPPALFEGAGVPVRAVNAAPGLPSSMETAVDTNRRHADFDAVLIEGVGHFLMLEEPDAVNRHLRTFVDEIVAAGQEQGS